jgi:DNA-binding IclR family transcriptional regulator
MAQGRTSEGFERLQDLLVELRTGDEVCSSEVARASGLSEDTCRRVLEGLTRAGLMTDESNGRFVRRSLDLLGP